ncbi:MAG: sugar phosphate isomerase/epimerase family protein, partial [Planctomycetota bacterium]|nr:sugar phosphate isomerase/epimerase family protein [Planctomycetota bacterium]
IQLACLKMPFKKAIKTAAQLGADAVEIDARNHVKPSEMSLSAIRHLRKTLEDLNLKVSALSFQTRRGYSDFDDIERRIDATKDALKMAYQLGSRVVVNQIGSIPTESDDENRSLLLSTLADLGTTSQRVGAFLAARTGNEDALVLRNLIQELPTGSLAIDFDPGNLIIHGFSASEAIQQLGEYTIHVHARDGVQDLAQGRGVEVPLGRGSADFPHLLGVLEEHHYRGFFTIQRDHASEPVFEVGHSIEFMKNI